MVMTGPQIHPASKKNTGDTERQDGETIKKRRKKMKKCKADGRWQRGSRGLQEKGRRRKKKKNTDQQGERRRRWPTASMKKKRKKQSCSICKESLCREAD